MHLRILKKLWARITELRILKDLSRHNIPVWRYDQRQKLEVGSWRLEEKKRLKLTRNVSIKVTTCQGKYKCCVCCWIASGSKARSLGILRGRRRFIGSGFGLVLGKGALQVFGFGILELLEHGKGLLRFLGAFHAPKNGSELIPRLLQDVGIGIGLCGSLKVFKGGSIVAEQHFRAAQIVVGVPKTGPDS